MAGLHDGELVTACARDQVIVAQQGLQAAGDCAKQGIADRMPQGVIDGLEVVEVKAKDGGLPAALPDLQHFLDVLAQLNAICQPCQRVVMR
jgi:hypothetical protein